MYNRINIKDLVEYLEKDYIKFIKKTLKYKEAFYMLDEIDDYLGEIIESDPILVERICRLNMQVYLSFKGDEKHNFLIGYNYNTLVVSLIRQDKIPEAKKMFFEAIIFCKENNCYEPGKSISQNIFSINIPHDEFLHLLSIITAFYNSIEKYEDSIEVLCEAANHFADVSAFQAAYRALYDAFNINKTFCKNLSILYKIRETQGRIALIEGDLNCAEAEFQACYKICGMTKEEPSFTLRFNMATIRLYKKDFKKARKMFEDLRSLPVNEFTPQIKINLLVCYRELNENDLTKKTADEIIADLDVLSGNALIEAKIILAKTFFITGDQSKGTEHLKSACLDIQEEIDLYQRLHYRRGIREKYLSKIKDLLTYLPDYSEAAGIPLILAFCKSNSLFDWFSFLEWYDNVNSSTGIPDEAKKELVNKTKRLIDFGAPFLYGYKEKYDDPFQISSHTELEKEKANFFIVDDSLPWKEFNNITFELCNKYSLTSPFSAANIRNCEKMLSESKSSAFLFSFSYIESCILFFVFNNKVIKAEFPIQNLLDFYNELYDYQRNNIYRNEFFNAINILEQVIKPSIDKFIDVFSDNNLIDFIFIPDSLAEGMPVLPVLLSNEKIRLNAKKGQFTYRTIPAIIKESTTPMLKGDGVFISNSEEGLEFCNEEKINIKKLLKDYKIHEIDLKNEDADFAKHPLATAGFLHLSSHNLPANMFMDPAFISTSMENSKNGLWLDSVQREIIYMNLNLIILNGCNTGTTVSRNYFKNHSTNERAGLSSVFLLNRQSAVIATQWNEPEIISYIFSVIFYKRLEEHNIVAKSFILSIVDLYELNKQDIIHLLETIEDVDLRKSKIDYIKGAPDFPFRNSYFLSLFQYVALLPE